MTRAPLLVVSLACAVAVFGCSPADGDAGSAENEIATRSYVFPRVSCKPTGKVVPVDGAVISVDVSSMYGRGYLDINQWRLVSGMTEPLEGFFSEEVESMYSRGHKLHTETAQLTLADASDGGLIGTFKYQGQVLTLDCEPVALFCSTPKNAAGEGPIGQLIFKRAMKKVGDKGVSDGVLVEELTVRSAPAGDTVLLDATLAFEQDHKGLLTAREAHASDPNVGALDMRWDASTRQRVATFSPSAALEKQFVIPAGGFDKATCDISARMPPASH